jgi:hypothetical protein
MIRTFTRGDNSNDKKSVNKEIIELGMTFLL